MEAANQYKEQPTDEQAWAAHQQQQNNPSAQSYRLGDIVQVLNGLRQEGEQLEAEIQKVEQELMADQENKVLNRKFDRLTEEKRNKEARRERLEAQLTAPPDHLFPSPQQGGQGLLPDPSNLSIPPHPAGAYYQVAGIKRDREDGQPDYHQQMHMVQGMGEGVHEIPGAPPRGSGRGGKGGQKFCKRCKERITYGHQQKCKFCRKCYEDTKTLVLREQCLMGHNNEQQGAAQQHPQQQQPPQQPGLQPQNPPPAPAQMPQQYVHTQSGLQPMQILQMTQTAQMQQHPQHQQHVQHEHEALQVSNA